MLENLKMYVRIVAERDNTQVAAQNTLCSMYLNLLWVTCETSFVWLDRALILFGVGMDLGYVGVH